MQKDPIHISNLNEKALEELTSLFNEVRNFKFKPVYFMKKYAQSWVKHPLFGSLLYVYNKLVGFAGTTLYSFRNSSKEPFLIGQLSDLIMDQEYQGKGLFKKLLNDLESSAREIKLDGLIVFPNTKAQHLFNKRENWQKTGEFMYYDFSVKTTPLLKVLNKLKCQNFFFYLGKISGSSEYPKTKWDTVDNSDIIETVQDDSYFRYKKYNPYLFHKYSEKEFLWSLSDGIVINSTQVKTKSELKEEIKYLKKFCRNRGVHRFAYICYSKTELNSLLEQTCKGESLLPVYYYSINPDIKPENICLKGIDRNAF